ncbi:MAG TPA: hypothetical protein VGM88_22075 [Kofleriaceae bacterium]|jgi:hypothetical protein
MRFAYVVLLAAACRPPGPATTTSAPAVPGVGCPNAKDVYMASFLTPGEGGKGHTGWVLPLFDAKVDSAKGMPEFAEVTAQAAQAAGAPAAPPNIWLMLPNQAPCRASLGSYFAVATDGAAPNVTYGVELGGCTPPPVAEQQDAEAIALVSTEPPNECTVLAPQPVAQRLGEMDKDHHWERPKEETPVPPPVAAAIPGHSCAQPDCETLWSIAQVAGTDNKPIAWAGAVNWITVGDAKADQQCSLPTQSFSGIFLPSADGTKATKLESGMDHPLALSSVLTDKTGPKTLIAEGPGEYTTYDLAAPAPAVAHHLVWLTLDPAAYTVDDHLGPDCPPPGAAPADPYAPKR